MNTDNSEHINIFGIINQTPKNLSGSKSEMMLSSTQNPFVPNPNHYHKSHSSYFGSEEDENGESESEWAHPGISMQRIEEKITEAIGEANKGIDTKIQALNDLLKNDVLSVVNEIKQTTLSGLTKAIDDITCQMNDDKKTLMNMIFEHKITIDGFHQRLTDHVIQQDLKRRKDRTDISSSVDKIFTLATNNSSNIKMIDVSIYNISEVIKTLIEVEKLNHTLSIQDEEDRHSIALWGTQKYNKDTNRKQELIEQANLNKDHFAKHRKSMNEQVQTNFAEIANSSVRILKENAESQELNKSQIMNYLNTSKDFTQFTSRQSSSLLRTRKNPFGDKKSLPQITQMQSSTNAANILMIDK